MAAKVRRTPSPLRSMFPSMSMALRCFWDAASHTGALQKIAELGKSWARAQSPYVNPHDMKPRQGPDVQIRTHTHTQRLWNRPAYLGRHVQRSRRLPKCHLYISPAPDDPHRFMLLAWLQTPAPASTNTGQRFGPVCAQACQKVVGQGR